MYWNKSKSWLCASLESPAEASTSSSSLSALPQPLCCSCPSCPWRRIFLPQKGYYSDTPPDTDNVNKLSSAGDQPCKIFQDKVRKIYTKSEARSMSCPWFTWNMPSLNWHYLSFTWHFPSFIWCVPSLTWHAPGFICSINLSNLTLKN